MSQLWDAKLVTAFTQLFKEWFVGYKFFYGLPWPLLHGL